LGRVPYYGTAASSPRRRQTVTGSTITQPTAEDFITGTVAFMPKTGYA
jgi:hypothetical protein